MGIVDFFSVLFFVRQFLESEQYIGNMNNGFLRFGSFFGCFIRSLMY